MMKLLIFLIGILIVLQVQGIPKRNGPRPDALWDNPDYGYICHAENDYWRLFDWPGIENAETMSCKDFCGDCCGSLSKYQNPNELREYCCPAPTELNVCVKT